jgi:hypothetical protein
VLTTYRYAAPWYKISRSGDLVRGVCAPLLKKSTPLPLVITEVGTFVIVITRIARWSNILSQMNAVHIHLGNIARLLLKCDGTPRNQISSFGETDESI